MRFRVVHSFYNNLSLAKKNLSKVKTKWDSAYLINETDGQVIVLFETDNYKEAEKILHKVFSIGLWCGIQRI